MKMLLLAALLVQTDGQEELGEVVHPRWAELEPTFTPGLCPFHGQVDYDDAIVKCGTVEVPENRSDPDSRLISIAVMRITPTVENAPPMVRLDGGPGGPGLAPQRARLFSQGVGDALRPHRRGHLLGPVVP